MRVTHGASEEEMEAEHSPEAIRARLQEGHQESYLRDVIFGAVDGTITTFAVVAGAYGTGLSAGIIVVMGFANHGSPSGNQAYPDALQRPS